MQRELATTANMVIKLNCENVPQEGDKSFAKMQELIEKAIK
jgi:hypothetical protein